MMYIFIRDSHNIYKYQSLMDLKYYNGGFLWTKFVSPHVPTNFNRPLIQI